MKTNRLHYFFFSLLLLIPNLFADLEIYWMDGDDNQLLMSDGGALTLYYGSVRNNYVGTRLYESFWVYNNSSEAIDVGSIRFSPIEGSTVPDALLQETYRLRTNASNWSSIAAYQGVWVSIQVFGLKSGTFDCEMEFRKSDGTASNLKNDVLTSTRLNYSVMTGNPEPALNWACFIPKSIPRNSLRYLGNYRFESDVFGRFTFDPSSWTAFQHDVLGPLDYFYESDDNRVHLGTQYFGYLVTWFERTAESTCVFPDLHSSLFDGFFRMNLAGGKTPFYSYNNSNWQSAIGGVHPTDGEGYYYAVERMVTLLQTKIHEIRVRRDQAAALAPGNPALPNLYSASKATYINFHWDVCPRMRFYAERGAKAWEVLQNQGASTAQVNAAKNWIEHNNRILGMTNQLQADLTSAFCDEFLSVISQRWSNPAENLYRYVYLDQMGSGTNIAMKYVWPGTFTMGSSKYESSRNSDETQHQVTLARGFWMGRYEVRQREYEFITGQNPSSNPDEPYFPVNNMSWNSAIVFCNALTHQQASKGRLKSTQHVFSLPTEAQWEYTCRAGTNTAYSFGSNSSSLYRYGNYSGSTDGYSGIARTGQFRSNAWGFYDMHGNVSEWCRDWYDRYPTDVLVDPGGPGSGKYRVFRGGDYLRNSGDCRSAQRHRYYPSSSSSRYGFRVMIQPL